jgi:predicted AAA+ superfamily ATPase
MEAINYSPVSDTPTEKADIASSIGENFKEHLPLAERFGLDGKKLPPHVDRNLSMIWKWAKEHAETPDKDSILWQVTKLSNRLGDAHSGSAPYTKVLTYVSTYNTMKESENRLREMGG